MATKLATIRDPVFEHKKLTFSKTKCWVKVSEGVGIGKTKVKDILNVSLANLTFMLPMNESNIQGIESISKSQVFE